MHEMLVDTISQGTDPLGLLLGEKFLNLGIRQKDKETNRKIKVYREVGKEFVKKRLDEMRKSENLEARDILSSLYKNKMVGKSA